MPTEALSPEKAWIARVARYGLSERDLPQEVRDDLSTRRQRIVEEPLHYACHPADPRAGWYLDTDDELARRGSQGESLLA